MTMSKGSKIIKFSRVFSARSISSNEHEDDFDDFEDWESYAQLIEKQDYPGLVRYCKKGQSNALMISMRNTIWVMLSL